MGADALWMSVDAVNFYRLVEVVVHCELRSILSVHHSVSVHLPAQIQQEPYR